jgi:hypothetical protein
MVTFLYYAVEVFGTIVTCGGSFEYRIASQRTRTLTHLEFQLYVRGVRVTPFVEVPEWTGMAWTLEDLQKFAATLGEPDISADLVERMTPAEAMQLHESQFDNRTATGLKHHVGRFDIPVTEIFVGENLYRRQCAYSHVDNSIFLYVHAREGQ